MILQVLFCFKIVVIVDVAAVDAVAVVVAAVDVSAVVVAAVDVVAVDVVAVAADVATHLMQKVVEEENKVGKKQIGNESFLQKKYRWREKQEKKRE